MKTRMRAGGSILLCALTVGCSAVARNPTPPRRQVDSKADGTCTYKCADYDYLCHPATWALSGPQT